MTAPTVDAPAVDIPQGAAPVRLPVMVVEGMETADGRFIEVGALSARTMPIALYSQVRSSHGSLDGDTATVLTGAITKASRRPGPEVTQLSTGQPFPDGTYVWEGEGWMYQDVPAPPEKSAYTLIKDKALRGNSVDLSEVDAEFVYADGQDLADDPRPQRIVITQGVIGATTLVGQPAFPDAYIELDGVAMEMADAVTAGGVPMWRSPETGDVCGPCSAQDGPHDAVITAALGAGPDSDGQVFALGDDIDPDDITPRHTGGMIALIPANPSELAVPGGDPAEEMHLTLAFLGGDVTEWPPELADAILKWAMVSTGNPSDAADLDGDDSPGLFSGPVQGSVFAHAVFNPTGPEPAAVHLLDGTLDRYRIDRMAERTKSAMVRILGALFPEQHSPFVPHVTAGYGLDPSTLSFTGPVTFDRLRVALAGRSTDFRMGGGGVTLVSAAAYELPPVEWFQDPQLDGPTPPTVDADGRAYGHLACWGTCHIGFSGKCVTPPRSASSYAYFMVHSAQAVYPDGTQIEVPVGWGTIGTGHADVRQGALAAAEHYDHTGTVAFEYAVGEDAYGIWFAGRMLPGLPEDMERKARGAVFSGDWRTIRGNLELVASLGVNVPGFPVPRVRVASGAPFALVAAGVPRAAEPMATDDTEFQEILAYVRAEQDSKRVATHLDFIADLTESVDADLEMSMANQLADILLAIDPDFVDIGADGDFAKRQNWVSKAGGLPAYIKRIEKHLMAKGMSESRAIATAKNAAQKMCDTGDLNFPGSQEVNPGSRAEACAAIAEWNAKRKAS
jgi:hypothetical protein